MRGHDRSGAQGVKVLALPRDPNPFQEKLYTRLRADAVVVDYLEGPTGSQTLNLALAPLLLVARRLATYRVLHVHWVFGFVPAWARGRPAARAFRAWYRLVLATARLLGFRVVWTAHNVLPHSPVFDDDAAARGLLVRRCDHVVAMNGWVADAVRSRFAPRCPVSVIPHGVDPVAGVPAITGPVRTVAFFGRVEAYKGVDDLLRAWDAAELPDGVTCEIAGSCADPELAGSLTAQAGTVARPVHLQLRALDDAELTDLLVRADLVVLPFRAISTSGSLLTAMQSGRPVLVPDLPAFADIPDDALLRYSPGPGALPAAIERAVAASPSQRRAVVAAAGRYLATLGWDGVAAEYERVFVELLGRAA